MHDAGRDSKNERGGKRIQSCNILFRVFSVNKVEDEKLENPSYL